MVDVILGLQWGDEGKGKIVDYFAPSYDMIARFQGVQMPDIPYILMAKKLFCTRYLPAFFMRIKSISLAMALYWILLL